MKTCQMCQNKFTPTGRNQKYCKATCNTRAYNLSKGSKYEQQL